MYINNHIMIRMGSSITKTQSSSSSILTKAYYLKNTPTLYLNKKNHYSSLSSLSTLNNHSQYKHDSNHPFVLKCYYSNTPINKSHDKKQNESQNNEFNESLLSSSLSPPPPTTTPTLIYEGPFASLSRRLKRISVTSAIVSIIGIPLLITFHSGDVPASGQMAVGATAIIAATGSTAALSFCFGPYVNTLTLEEINNSKNNNHNINNNSDENSKTNNEQNETLLIKATTTNIFGMTKETIFNPKTDVTQPLSSKSGKHNYRPFCNFLVRDDPFYIHPELLDDEMLRIQLLGEELGRLVKDDNDGGDNEEKMKKKKALDDDFI